MTARGCAVIGTASRSVCRISEYSSVQCPCKYELKKRAERQQQTRRRIVEAAVELHTELGPAATSISAIADRAGVQRHTVYSHFPTELDLGMACSGLHFEREPPPDPELLAVIEDGEERLRAGLEALYAYFERNEQILTHVQRDAEVHETTRIVFEPRSAPPVRLHEVLAAGLPARGRRRARRDAALGRGHELPDLAHAGPSGRVVDARGRRRGGGHGARGLSPQARSVSPSATSSASPSGATASETAARHIRPPARSAGRRAGPPPLPHSPDAPLEREDHRPLGWSSLSRIQIRMPSASYGQNAGSSSAPGRPRKARPTGLAPSRPPRAARPRRPGRRRGRTRGRARASLRRPGRTTASGRPARRRRRRRPGRRWRRSPSRGCPRGRR